LSNSLLIRASDGKVNDFSRERLFLSVYRSLSHRKQPITDAAAITDTIIARLIEFTNGPIVEREDLIKQSYGVLSNFDKAAVVHYKAYYPII
jgi:transcriptional regulator NrdR family protein